MVQKVLDEIDTKIIKHLLKDARKKFSDIAKDCKVSTATVRNRVNKMEKDGLLKRVKDTPKSTLTRLELTSKGFEALESSKPLKSINYIMKFLSKEDREKMKSMLGQIITYAEKYNPS